MNMYIRQSKTNTKNIIIPSLTFANSVEFLEQLTINGYIEKFQKRTKNKRIADEIEKIHTESPDKGYRRIRDELERYHNIDVNDKRVLRICRKLNIKSTIKYSNNGCTRQASNPQYIAENILNREFTADAPNENGSQM